MAGPRMIVEPPVFTPLSYGLLNAVDYPPSGDGHWQNGVTFESICLNGQGDTTYDECIAVTGVGGLAPPPPPPFSDNVDKVFRGATPFTTWVEFDCSPIGNIDAVKRLNDAFARADSWQVERAFWTGVAANRAVVWPHLAANADLADPQGIMLQTEAVIVTGSASPMDAVEALGAIEKGMADCYNGVGVIHIPQGAVPSFDKWGLLRTNGPTLRTLNGNKVAVGAGYPGTGPDGSVPAAGTSWIYGTGAVFAYKGDVRTSTPNESIDRARNTIHMIGQRTWLLGWDCCQVAALVQLSASV